MDCHPAACGGEGSDISKIGWPLAVGRDGGGAESAGRRHGDSPVMVADFRAAGGVHLALLVLDAFVGMPCFVKTTRYSSRGPWCVGRSGGADGEKSCYFASQTAKLNRGSR